MTAMAEKLKDAGVDTIGAALTAACIEGLRQHPDSVIEAWHYAGSVFGHEFVRGLMRDMQGSSPVKSVPSNHSVAGSKAYQPRVIPPERLERRRELQRIISSKYKNSANIAWSDVGWHELSALKRDGLEAAALLAAGPATVPNDGRSVGDVLGIKRTDEIIEQLRLPVRQITC